MDVQVEFIKSSQKIQCNKCLDINPSEERIWVGWIPFQLSTPRPNSRFMYVCSNCFPSKEKAQEYLEVVITLKLL